MRFSSRSADTQKFDSAFCFTIYVQMFGDVCHIFCVFQMHLVKGWTHIWFRARISALESRSSRLSQCMVQLSLLAMCSIKHRGLVTASCFTLAHLFGFHT